MSPFLKWPGGKRWLVAQYPNLFPTNFNRYIEPFLGGGAVFFHLLPKKAILSDINPDVIAAYEGVRDEQRKVCQALWRHQGKHTKDYYYHVRAMQCRTKATAAARIIYLNRTCFNGIYRVNARGEFNVPIGTRTNVISSNEDLKDASEAMSSAKIVLEDFEKTIKKSKKNDFLFVDPPYTVRHNNNGFVKYNETLFSWDDQIRLAKCLDKARQRGVKIMITNANHDSVRELYENRGFNFLVVSRFSSISANVEFRKEFEELIITANLQKGRA